MNDLFKAVLPTIAKALVPGAGMLAGVALSWLGGKLGVPPEQVEATINNMKPEDILAMKKLDNEFKLDMGKIGIRLDELQIEVNKEEAKSASIWVAGWRPAVGWAGAVGFAYAAILEPLLRFVSQVIFHYGGQFPVIDTMLTMQVLFGLLGLAGLRSLDKKNGVATA